MNEFLIAGYHWDNGWSSYAGYVDDSDQFVALTIPNLMRPGRAFARGSEMYVGGGGAGFFHASHDDGVTWSRVGYNNDLALSGNWDRFALSGSDTVLALPNRWTGSQMLYGTAVSTDKGLTFSFDDWVTPLGLGLTVGGDSLRIHKVGNFLTLHNRSLDSARFCSAIVDPDNSEGVPSNWLTWESNVGSATTAVSFPVVFNETTALMVMEGATGSDQLIVFKTNDQGATWSQVLQVDAVPPLRPQACFAGDVTYLTDGVGNIYTSLDQGSTWSSENMGADLNIIYPDLIRSRFWMAGSSGTEAIIAYRDL